jgi:hypothetical protein
MLPHLKISLSKAQFSHIATFINILGRLQLGDSTTIDYILIDRRRHSIVLDVRSFRAADCDTDHYLVVAKIRKRIAGNKQGSHKFHMERFNLRKLKKLEAKVKGRVEVSNRFAALKDLDAEVEINTIWEAIRENIKISAKECLAYYELKQHKP